MPFTFAHPAIVIPLKEKWPKWFNSTALIIGSMAPDFEYFIRFKAQAVVGHTLGGFLYFNLPLVFLVALLWHKVIKKPFILNLPSSIRKCFMPLLSSQLGISSIKTLIIFMISSIIGMISHVFWDGFTHTDAYFVSRMPFLSQQIVLFGSMIAVYKILQHGSTLAGFGAISMYMYLLSRNICKVLPKTQMDKQLGYWVSVFLVAFGVITLRTFYTLGAANFNNYGIYIVSFISGLIIGVVTISFVFQTFKLY